jgi:hypothetical protein
MVRRETRRAGGWWLAALAAVGALAGPARAADLDKVDAALKLLPADTAFYSAMLRNKEQCDALMKSKAWAKLNGLPAVKFARQMIEAQLANPQDPQAAAFLKALKEPENQELLALLGDAVSDEVFCYGGDTLNGFVELLSRVQAGRFGPAVALATGQAAGKKAEEIQARYYLHVLAQNLDLIRTPDLVLGFRIKDAKRAENQLKRLEELVKGLNPQLPPPLQDRLKRVKVGDSSLLNFTVDGSLVPWDQIPIKDYEDKEGEFDPLLKKLKGLTVSVSLGVHQGYLLLAVGASPEGIAKIGGPGDRLTGRPELKPLAKYADRKLTSIGYVSKALRSQTGWTAKDLDVMAADLQSALGQAKLPEDKVQAINKDLERLAGDLKKNLPEIGAQVDFSFTTDRGHEGYTYEYGTHPGLDGTKPLTILEHAGGDPIFVGAVRGKSDPESYKTFVKWVKVAYGHVEDVVLANLGDDEKEKYKEVSKELFPLLRRLDEVTGTMLLPALADGQAAFVLDAKWKSKQWHEQAPATPEAMPLPELGLLLGVSNAELFQKAMASYRALANDAIAKAKQMAPPGQIPDAEIPAPKIENGTAGKLAWYPIPAEWGLDKQVSPTAGLSSNLAVLTLSRAHTERLLTPTPLKVAEGPLADRKRPLAAANYFNFNALVDAATPWVVFGVQTAKLPPLPGGGADADWLPQVKTVLEVLRCYRGTSSASYLEDGVLVTHTESVVEDLK